MEIDKIVFYYPSRITGGAEYLFMRCAEYLSTHQEKYTIYYVDYEDGFVRKNISSSCVSFLDFEEYKKIDIKSGTAVIVQLNILPRIDELFCYDFKQSLFIFWCLHTLNLKGFINRREFYFLTKNELRHLGNQIRILSEMNIVKYMGPVAYIKVVKDMFQKPQQFEWLRNITPNYINVDELKVYNERISCDEIKFCWLGRLSDEKVYNVVTYMNELEAYAQKHKLSLSLIGKGTSEEYLKEVATHYSYPIRFVGEKRDEELNQFIINETEIGLASGTSALEFAMRGKPVIFETVIDKIYDAGQRKKYFLMSMDNLKIDKDTMDISHEGECDFERKVDQVLSNYSAISKAEFKYTKQFTASDCTNKLIDAIEYVSRLDSKSIDYHVKRAIQFLNRGRKRIYVFHKIRIFFQRFTFGKEL